MQMLRFHPFSSLPPRLNEMTHSLRKSRRRLVWGLKRCCSAPAAKWGNRFCSYTKIVTLSSPGSYFCLILNLCSILDQSSLKDLLVGVHHSADDKFRGELDFAFASSQVSEIIGKKKGKKKRINCCYLVCLMLFCCFVISACSQQFLSSCLLSQFLKFSLNPRHTKRWRWWKQLFFFGNLQKISIKTSVFFCWGKPTEQLVLV